MVHHDELKRTRRCERPRGLGRCVGSRAHLQRCVLRADGLTRMARSRGRYVSSGSRARMGPARLHHRVMPVGAVRVPRTALGSALVLRSGVGSRQVVWIWTATEAVLVQRAFVTSPFAIVIVVAHDWLW